MTWYTRNDKCSDDCTFGISRKTSARQAQKHNSIYLLVGVKRSFILLMIQIFYTSHEFSISIKYFFKLYISSYFIVRLVVNNIFILIYHFPHTSIYTTTGNQMAPIIFASTLKPRPLHQKKENRWSQVNHFEIRLCSLPNSQTVIGKVYFPLSQPNTIHRCYCVCKRMKS